MFTLNERIVQDEEHGGGIVRDLRAAKEVSANIADVANLGMLEAITPQNERRVLDACSYRNGHNNARRHAEHGERPDNSSTV